MKDVRHEPWYYPRDVKNISVAKSMLSPGEDPETGDTVPAYTEEQIKLCTLALIEGSHLTDGKPLSESEYGYWCDDHGPKGLWVTRKLIYPFFENPPEPPPYWKQPDYDNWVRIFGAQAAKRLKWTQYAGWDHRGPDGSGIPPDELGKYVPNLIVQYSLICWRDLYGQA